MHVVAHLLRLGGALHSSLYGPPASSFRNTLLEQIVLKNAVFIPLALNFINTEKVFWPSVAKPGLSYSW